MGVIRKKTATRGGEGGVKYVCDVCSADITSTVSLPFALCRIALLATLSEQGSQTPLSITSCTPSFAIALDMLVRLTRRKVRIRCAHSACNEYDLCVQCFASGASSGSHQPATHPYRVIEQNSIPIFDHEWGADEELLLLEGCEIYGLGSWADIADHIGGYRNKDEVREHYLKVYVHSPSFPLPKRCRPDDMELAQEISRDQFQARKKRRIEERREAQKNAPLLPPKTKSTASTPSCHEIQGYMPGRLEFETEFANEAEEAVQLMQFDPGDGINPRTGELEPEMELKLTVMDIYNCRLTQRVDRKKVIFEHNLLEYRENTRIEKKRTKEERDLINRAKPFARMMNRTDFEALCLGLLDELNLRQAITQLQEWRNLKIGDLRSGEKYEQEKAQRIQKTIPMGSMDRERMATAQRPKQNVQPEPPSGAALLIAPELPFRPGTNGMVTAQGTTDAPIGSESKPSADGHTNETGTNGVVTNGTSTQVRPRFVSQPISGVQPLALGEDNAPDLHLLTPEEVELCKVSRLQPKPYLMMKEQVLKEALKGNGSLKKKQVKEICRLDSQKGARIFDFFINSGWIAKA